MNEYLKIFQNIQQSVEYLLNNEYHSIESAEIKKSAITLQQSIQPCIQELKSSTIKLKGLIEPCAQNLVEAESIWKSKIKIAETHKDLIWQQIGEISACYFRIQQISIHQKAQLIKVSRESWEERIEELRKKWFLDEKKQVKISIGWNNKDGFNKHMLSKFTSYSQKLDNHINDALSLIFRELDEQYLVVIQSYVSLLDARRKTALTVKIEKALQELQDKFLNLKLSFPNSYILDLKVIFNPTFKAWASRWGDISWVEIAKLKDEVTEKSNQKINFLIDDRVESIKKVLEQAIAFYNEFLEEQERYQQETPEQRLAEKAWIDHQRQELEKLQASFNSVLEIPID